MGPVLGKERAVEVLLLCVCFDEIVDSKQRRFQVRRGSRLPERTHWNTYGNDGTLGLGAKEGQLLILGGDQAHEEDDQVVKQNTHLVVEGGGWMGRDRLRCGNTLSHDRSTH